MSTPSGSSRGLQASQCARVGTRMTPSAICQGRCREPTDDPIKKVLVLIEMDDVILRGGVSQKVIPSLRMARQIRGRVRVRVCIFQEPSPMILTGPKEAETCEPGGKFVGVSGNSTSCLPWRR